MDTVCGGKLHISWSRSYKASPSIALRSVAGLSQKRASTGASRYNVVLRTAVKHLQLDVWCAFTRKTFNITWAPRPLRTSQWQANHVYIRLHPRLFGPKCWLCMNYLASVSIPDLHDVCFVNRNTGKHCAIPKPTFTRHKFNTKERAINKNDVSCISSRGWAGCVHEFQHTSSTTLNTFRDISQLLAHSTAVHVEFMVDKEALIRVYH